jgi:hypothetical protein
LLVFTGGPTGVHTGMDTTTELPAVIGCVVR